MSTLRVGSPQDELSVALTAALVGFLDSREHVLKISNRYFDADVFLKPLDLLQHDNDSDSVTSGQEDGILLVFDDTSKGSFDLLGQIHANAESNQQNGDLLRLCIGALPTTSSGSSTAAMSSKEREEEYSRRVLWCLDHGYEYVEQVDLSPTGIQQGHDAREKESFARVIEAIQGTVWSCAKMHAKQKKKQQAATVATSSSSASTETNSYEPPPTTATLSIPTNAVSDKEAREREETARQALLQQDGIDTDEKERSQCLDGNAQREQQADKIMHDMEGALKEANRIREMSRAGELSDEDRKKRAGDAATLIMNLMTQMGGFDDDDSDNDEGT